MLREVLKFILADEFLMPWNLAQEMERILERLPGFILARLTQQKMNLEFLPRVMQRHSAANPLVCFLTNAAWINQIKRNRFVEMPDVILPAEAEVVLVIFRFDLLFR